MRLSEVMGEISQCGSLDDLVAIAAAAQIAVERRFGHFCSNCGQRLGLRHATGCTFWEESRGGVVESFDTLDPTQLIETKAAELRGGR